MLDDTKPDGEPPPKEVRENKPCPEPGPLKKATPREVVLCPFCEILRRNAAWRYAVVGTGAAAVVATAANQFVSLLKNLGAF